MNREYKFRAWLKEKKKMIDVLSIEFDAKMIVFYEQDEEYEDVIRTKIVSFSDIGLMQYTGLKDKNGVEIYEGDILKYTNYDDPYHMGIVEYGHFNCSCCHAVFGFTTVDKRGYAIDMLIDDKNCTPSYEVVGNIYENPELLGGKK